MRILGIDPGYAILGYGIIEMRGNRFKVIDYGAVTTEAGMEMPDRLKVLYNSLMELIGRFEPEVASVEELFFNTNRPGESRCWRVPIQGWKSRNIRPCRLSRRWWETAERKRSRYSLW